MNKDVKVKWLQALRSGEYEQGKRRLNDDGATFEEIADIIEKEL